MKFHFPFFFFHCLCLCKTSLLAFFELIVNQTKNTKLEEGQIVQKFIFRKEYKSIEVFTQPRVTKNDHHIVVNKTFRS